MYRIGLDVGIKSVGWSVVECDNNGEPLYIKALNSRIFDVAENPKNGDSLAQPRRLARGLRRRIARKTLRLVTIDKLFRDNGISLFINNDGEYELKDEYKNIDVLSKRVEALDKLITQEEFARVLYSIAKHRGFKSNKKPGAKSSEDGVLLTSIENNNKKMSELGYRTIGELLLKEYSNKDLPIHNKGGDYSRCISRDALEEEVKALFEKQKSFGNKFASNENLEKYLKIFLAQRTFDEGPGKGSKYTGSHAVRKCIFYKNEDVCARGTLSNELSTFYQKANIIQIVNDGDRRKLSSDEIQKLLDNAQQKAELKYKDVRKLLGLKDDEKFSVLNYSLHKKKQKDGSVVEESIFKCEDAKFVSLKSSNDIRKVLSEKNRNDIDVVDAVAEICTKYTSEDLFKKAIAEDELLKGRLSEEEIASLLNLDMKGYGHLSKKALSDILPYLKDGFIYSEACEKAGHNHSENNFVKGKYLGKNEEVKNQLNDITSPVTKRAITQTIKVIDAIIREYGSPYAINIELARDMSLSRKERDKVTKDNQERANINNEIRENISECGAVVNSTNILKKKLYEEQNGKCAYSGQLLDIDKLYVDGYYEIDHIIPYSRSFDDSFNNKVLVLKVENQNKRNNTPYEYFKRIGRDWDEYCVYCKTIYQKNNAKKLENLLKTSFNETEWKSRALNDTRYASRMLANLIKDYLVFDENAKGKKHVITVKGGVTSYLRRFWGIQKIRSDGDKHHAIDATIIACVTDGINNKIERYNQAKEYNRVVGGEYMLEDGEVVSSEYYDKNSKLILPYPYLNFREELIARVEDSPVIMENALRRIGMNENYIMNAHPFVVSRMTHRKAKGCIHEATVWSSKYVENKDGRIHDGESIIVKRTPVEKLSIGKDGEINGYFNPEGDIRLYNAIKERLLAFGGKGEKAFAEPLYKPCNNGQGNIVRTVKTYEKYFGGGFKIDKNKGIVANGSMIRVDLYSKDNKYFGVPVYTADLYKGVLPKKAATQGKAQKDWRVMDDSYTFEMSIYPNDLLRIESKKEIVLKKSINDEFSPKADSMSFTNEFVYFNSYNISTAAIKIEDTSGCYSASSIGIQGLKKITKCEIDVLGNVNEVSSKPLAPMPLNMISEKERAYKRAQKNK